MNTGESRHGNEWVDRQGIETSSELAHDTEAQHWVDGPAAQEPEREFFVSPIHEIDPDGVRSAVRDCENSLAPLIERAAVTCDSLRECCRLAAPSEQSLREAAQSVTALLDRAGNVVPALESAVEAAAQAASAPGEHVRGLVYDAITSMRQELEARALGERGRIDLLEAQLTEQVAGLGERLQTLAKRAEQSNQDQRLRHGAAPADSDGLRSLQDTIACEPLALDRASIDAAIDQAIGEGVTRTLTLWERETVQLMELFRARVERAIQSVESAAAERARQLDDLCGKADRIFAQSGGDPSSLTSVVGELVESMKPWRGLLIEGKCGPDLAPLVQTIVERVRADIRGELAGRPDDHGTVTQRPTLRTSEQASPVDEAIALGGAVYVAEHARGADTHGTAPTRAAKALRVGPSGINASNARAAIKPDKARDGSARASSSPSSSASAKPVARTGSAPKRRAA